MRQFTLFKVVILPSFMSSVFAVPITSDLPAISVVTVTVVQVPTGHPSVVLTSAFPVSSSSSTIISAVPTSKIKGFAPSVTVTAVAEDTFSEDEADVENQGYFGTLRSYATESLVTSWGLLRKVLEVPSHLGDGLKSVWDSIPTYDPFGNEELEVLSDAAPLDNLPPIDVDHIPIAESNNFPTTVQVTVHRTSTVLVQLVPESSASPSPKSVSGTLDRQAIIASVKDSSLWGLVDSSSLEELAVALKSLADSNAYFAEALLEGAAYYYGDKIAAEDKANELGRLRRLQTAIENSQSTGRGQSWDKQNSDEQTPSQDALDVVEEIINQVNNIPIDGATSTQFETSTTFPSRITVHIPIPVTTNSRGSTIILPPRSSSTPQQVPTTTTTSLSTEKSAVNEELDEKQRLAESLKRLEDSFTIPAREYLNSLNGSANKLSSLTGELGPVDANDNDHLRTGNTMDVKDSSTGNNYSNANSAAAGGRSILKLPFEYLSEMDLASDEEDTEDPVVYSEITLP